MFSSAPSSTTGCWIVVACALLTVLLGFQATKLAINAGFEKMIPHGHAYVKNYLESRGSLRGLGNSVRVVVENTDGDIFDPAYLEVLKQVNDELFLMPDVDRAWMKSIWTPAVRWSEVNEEGFVGGPVMPDNYDGSPDVGGCAQAQHPPRQHRRQPGGQRLPFEHGVRAPARAQCGHRQAAGLPRVLAEAGAERPRQVREGRQRQGQDPRDRLRQAGRRPDRRPGQGRQLLPGSGADRRADHLPVHPLRAQHGAGGRLLGRRRGLAAGPGAPARLRAGPVLRARAVPDLRHRRQPRRAEDERHHAGRGPRHPSPGRRPLHLPPPVPRRPDRAARRRGRLRRADDDRHSGDQGTGADRQHRRRRAGVHQPDPAAGAAVLRRRQPGSGQAQPARGRQGSARSRLRRVLELPRPLHRTALGGGRDRVRGGARRGRPVDQPRPADRRSRSGRAGTAQGFALQPGQRLHHQRTTRCPATCSR